MNVKSMKQEVWSLYEKVLEEKGGWFSKTFSQGVKLFYQDGRIFIRMENEHIAPEKIVNGPYADVLPAIEKKEILDQDVVTFSGANYNYYLSQSMIEKGHADWLKDIAMSADSHTFEWVFHHNIYTGESDICSEQEIHRLVDIVLYIAHWKEFFLKHPEDFYYEDMLTPGILGVAQYTKKLKMH